MTRRNRTEISRAIRSRASATTIVAILFALIGLRDSTAEAFPYSDFFTPANPQRLSLTLFASGIGAESKYAATHEGFQLEQTLNPYIGVVGRISGYQNYQGSGWDNPLTPHPGTRPRNFGVFMAGLDLLPFQGTSLTILGGRDVGDSDGARIEGDFSSWILLHSRHPINLSFTGDHFYNNGQSSGAIDVRVVMASWREVTWLLGAGGQLWFNNSLPNLQKEFGPDLGLFFRPWNLSLDLQAGYGNLHGYATLAVSKHFDWDDL